MSSEAQQRNRIRPGNRSNRLVRAGRIQAVGRGLVPAVLAAGILLLAACGGAGPTAAPTVVVVATTPAATATPSAVPPTGTPPATDTVVPATDTPLPPIDTSTSTPVPTDTPLPPTATPTSTPLPPTATPVPPTATPVPPTRTPAPPTKTPKPPTATVPPAPKFAWRGQVVNTFANCALTRIMGLVLARNGGIAGDIWVHTWADGWEGAWSLSRWNPDEGYAGMDDSSNWDATLATYAKAGTWMSCVVPAEGSWNCISTTVTSQTTSEPCAPDSGGVQIVRIVFQQN